MGTVDGGKTSYNMTTPPRSLGVAMLGMMVVSLVMSTALAAAPADDSFHPNPNPPVYVTRAKCEELCISAFRIQTSMHYRCRELCIWLEKLSLATFNKPDDDGWLGPIIIEE